MRAHAMIGVARPFLFVLALLTSCPASAAGWVGAYVWGGVVARSTGVQRFYDTVELVLREGFDTIRVAPGPTAIDGVTIPGCTGASDTLVCYAKVMFASPVWDNPGLKRVMLTAIDRTCVNAAPSNVGCFTGSILAANKAAIEQEYADLLAFLLQRFALRNIQLIISNWEGDNFVYCGSAFTYSHGGAPASKCMASLTSNGQTRAQRVQALLQWFSYKDEAVANFNAANPGANVIHAPEFSAYRMFAGGCGNQCFAGIPSPDLIIGAIKAAGGRPHCSYSSYDSQGPANGQYLSDVKEILKICQDLIIGEAGYDLRGKVAAGIAKNSAIFRALEQIRNVPGVLGVIPWNAVNPADAHEQFGMFDVTGKYQLLRSYGPLRPVRYLPH